MESGLLEKYVFSTIFNIPHYNIPEIADCFGVFTTIKTSKGEIHGCIGNWKNDYKVLSYEEKKKILKEVSYLAMYKDNRNKKETVTDMKTVLSVSLMRSPNFLKNKPEIFDNKNFGIIANQKNKRVCFLPNVFGNIKWEKLKQKLSEKANMQLNEETEFIYFSCLTYSSTFQEIILNLYRLYINVILKFFNNNYGYFFPYEVVKTKTQYIIKREPNEVTRNIATMGYLLKINKKFKVLSSSVISKIKKDLQSYDINNLSESEKAFFSRINNICMEGKVKNLERNFQLGQVLIANSKICKKDTSKDLDIMLSEITKMKMSAEIIFRLNWQCQAVCSNNFLDQNHLDILLDIFYKWYRFYYSDKIETNYLVVSFEFLNFQYYFSEKYKDQINRFIFETFIHLAKRFDLSLGLFRFLSGNCRIDITGHFLNSVNI